MRPTNFSEQDYRDMFPLRPWQEILSSIFPPLRDYFYTRRDKLIAGEQQKRDMIKRTKKNMSTPRLTPEHYTKNVLQPEDHIIMWGGVRTWSERIKDFFEEIIYNLFHV